MTELNTTCKLYDIALGGNLRIAGLANDSIVDGPGIRFTIFTQGCDKNCEGCHNPQTHDPNGGEEIAIETLFQKARKNSLIKGVTLSGGEPLLQAEALLPLVKKFKCFGYDVAMYTGDVFEQILQEGGAKAELVKLVDTLVDGAFVQSKRDYRLKFKGSTNQRVIDVQKSLYCNKTVLDKTERWNSDEELKNM